MEGKEDQPAPRELCFLCGLGYDKMQNSKAAIKIGDLEISASDKTSNESAYMLLGLGAVCLLGGLVMITRSKS